MQSFCCSWEGEGATPHVPTVNEQSWHMLASLQHSQYKVAAAFAVLRQPDCNFLEHMAAVDFQRMRRLVIDLVIATDMSMHKDPIFTSLVHWDGSGGEGRPRFVGS